MEVQDYRLKMTNCLWPLRSKARRFMFVGDQKQLLPIMISQSQNESSAILQRSLFETLVEWGQSTTPSFYVFNIICTLTYRIGNQERLTAGD
jgi:superfamily I DNA and/or RNA helicase